MLLMKTKQLIIESEHTINCAEHTHETNALNLSLTHIIPAQSDGVRKRIC